MKPIAIRVFALAAMTPALTSCIATPEELLQRDRTTCTAIGIPAGSQRYEDCVLQLQAARLGRHH